jgi:hypothetical protein
VDSFNTEHAKELKDVEGAVFIRGLQYLLTSHGKQAGGTWWYHGTMTALTAQFPYWTPRKLERVISAVVTAGVVVKDHPSGANRTCAYAFRDELRYLQADNPFAVDAAGCPCPFHETVKWSKQARAKAISRNGEMGTIPISPNGEMGTKPGTERASRPVPISRNGEMENAAPLPPAPPTRKGGGPNSDLPPSAGSPSGEQPRGRARLDRTSQSLGYGMRRVCDAYVARWEKAWPNLRPPTLQPNAKQAVKDAIKSVAEADDTDYATADLEVIGYVEQLADQRQPLLKLKWELENFRNGRAQSGRSSGAHESPTAKRDRILQELAARDAG